MNQKFRVVRKKSVGAFHTTHSFARITFLLFVIESCGEKSSFSGMDETIGFRNHSKTDT